MFSVVAVPRCARDSLSLAGLLGVHLIILDAGLATPLSCLNGSGGSGDVTAATAVMAAAAAIVLAEATAAEAVVGGGGGEGRADLVGASRAAAASPSLERYGRGCRTAGAAATATAALAVTSPPQGHALCKDHSRRLARRQWRWWRQLWRWLFPPTAPSTAWDIGGVGWGGSDH